MFFASYGILSYASISAALIHACEQVGTRGRMRAMSSRTEGIGYGDGIVWCDGMIRVRVQARMRFMFRVTVRLKVQVSVRVRVRVRAMVRVRVRVQYRLMVRIRDRVRMHVSQAAGARLGEDAG